MSRFRKCIWRNSPNIHDRISANMSRKEFFQSDNAIPVADTLLISEKNE